MEPVITPEIYEYVLNLEKDEEIDRFCKMCQQVFIPQLMEGKKLHNVFGPRHKASKRCESGKRPHCTCDTCF